VATPQAGEVRSWLLVPRPAPTAVRPLWPFLLPGVGGALAWLGGLGLPARARIGLCAGATPAVAALLQAAPLAGHTLVLLNRRLGAAEAWRQAGSAALTMLACDAGSPLAGHQQRALPEAFTDAPLAGTPATGAAPLAPEEPALVLFTSGTGGEPKAARLSQGALAAAARAAATRLALAPGQAWLGCLPLDHIGGASLAWRAGHSGQELLLTSRFDAPAVSALLDQAHGISVVATMLHRLVRERAGAPWPSRLATLLVGGGPLAEVLAAGAAGLGLEPRQTYGMSECASQACTPDAAEAPTSRGRAGRPLDGLELAIRRADGTAAEPGEVGTIHLRGAMLFSGYERAGRLAEPLPPGSWFSTCDLGEVDARGSLKVLCRREDLIICGGEKVVPAAVEAALEAHPQVQEAGVCALDDAEWGQVVAAVVVPSGPEPPALAELAAWVAARLAPFQRPRRWLLAAALPRTATGKLLRRQLPACFAGPDQ
jgi:O-succinylbenzoic acid--CoA ligase